MAKSKAVDATEGTTFPFTGYRKGEKATELLAVGPKCDLKEGGAWLCLTHPELMAMPTFAWEGHLYECKKPVQAWLCVVHGPEVP